MRCLTIQTMQNLSAFPNLDYLVEGRRYPVCILGGDRFVDWFLHARPIQLNTDYTFKIMRLSYESGVWGFDISCRFNLINAFKKLKDRFPEAIGIGNPNWLCGYKLKNTNLWDIKDRVVLTMIQKLSRENKSLKNLVAKIPESHNSRLIIKKGTQPLTDNEIKRIYIDEQVWLDRINLLQGVVDFCLIGADYADWMCGLNRLDLIRWQIETVRRNGMIPVSVSHLSSITIPLLDKEDFGAHWVYANRAWMYLDPELAADAIRVAAKPITAFKILSNIQLPDEIEPTIRDLRKLGVKSFVVGLENPEHIKYTLPRVMNALISISRENNN